MSYYIHLPDSLPYLAAWDGWDELYPTADQSDSTSRLLKSQDWHIKMSTISIVAGIALIGLVCCGAIHGGAFHPSMMQCLLMAGLTTFILYNIRGAIIQSLYRSDLKEQTSTKESDETRYTWGEFYSERNEKFRSELNIYREEMRRLLAPEPADDRVVVSSLISDYAASHPIQVDRYFPPEILED